MSDTLPTYDAQETVLGEIYWCPDGDNYYEVRHLRQAYLWEDIPFMPIGDHEHPVVSLPMLCSMTN